MRPALLSLLRRAALTHGHVLLRAAPPRALLASLCCAAAAADDRIRRAPAHGALLLAGTCESMNTKTQIVKIYLYRSGFARFSSSRYTVSKNTLADRCARCCASI